MAYRGTVHVRAHWRRLYPRGQSPNTRQKSMLKKYRVKKYYTAGK